MQTIEKRPGRIKSAIKAAVAGWIGKVIRLTDRGFWSSWYGTSSFTGETVTVNSALQLSAAWACIRLISETLSTLPMNVLKEQASGAKTVARDHNLHRLIHTQPNALMSASVFWQTFIASMLLWGAAYVQKHFSGRVITSLEFLQPDYVSWERVGDGVLWWYNDPVTKETRPIPEAEMWFTPFFTVDGFTGLSPVRMGANVFGGAIAADRASANTFKNGMKSSGLITVDSVLKAVQRDEIRAHVKKVSEEGGVFVFEKGGDFKPLTMNPQDAELLLTRSFNVEEICRWYRTDPSLVGHGSKDSNWGTGLEEKMLWLVTLTLRPLAVRIEQSIRKDLLSPVDRLLHSAEFALEGLMRGNSAARALFYQSMVRNGIFTRDFCRTLENQEPMGGNAAVLTVEANMMPLDKLGEAATASTTAADALKAWLGIETVSAGAPAKEQSNA